VVGIGASAGGLEALEALTRRLAADGMAFVIVQHLAPGHTSMLGEILSRGASLRVVTIEHAVRLDSGTIYVAPPAMELLVDGVDLRISPAPGPPASRHTIDAFFRSLARAGGPMVIGVVLSGSGNDGTLGLRAIKEEGGITFAQEPTTASHPSMPQSAIDAGNADFTLAPAEIGDELQRLSKHPYVGRPPLHRAIGADAMAKIFAKLQAAHGVDFTLYKPSTIERRIARRMVLHHVEKIEDYISILSSEAHELANLYDDLLIGVTSFFRDGEPYDALKNIVFPRLLENRGTGAPLRIWVAGCSSGEEAYSTAIALLEYLGDRAGSFRIQIFATDIDEEALGRARAAVYSTTIELDVSPERLRRFFVATDGGYRVSRQVRDLVVFARHDVGKDPPFSRLDLVTCRNVLIYMQTALQRKVLRIFQYALNPEGYLVLGTSESVGDAADIYSLLDRKQKIYVKKNLPPSGVFDFSFSGRPGGAGHEGDAEEPKTAVNVAQLADRKVMERYAPPGVIVDERLEVLQFRGRTGSYLEPAPGMATLSLFKLCRPELLVPLRTVVHKVLADKLQSASATVTLPREHGLRHVSVDVMPLLDTAGRKCLLILFHEVAASPADGEASKTEAAPSGDPRVAELERELATSKEYLQATIEELEASNEELQSANEELQSSNEELQSTNEELETSKEELQSTNEELATVNDELQNRMTQLSVANDDLQNVFSNAEPAIVIVGADLRIRRFSAKAEELLGLGRGDVGRPIAYLRNVMSARDIEEIAAESVASVSSRQVRVRCIDGTWHMMHLFPYVTTDHAIRGVVLELVKTTAPAATTMTHDIHVLAERVLSTFPRPILLVDTHLTIVWANKAFFETFAISPSAVGDLLPNVWGSKSEPPELWEFIDDLISGRPARDVLVGQPFGRGEHPMRFSGRTLPLDGERAVVAAVFMQEV
jgi:two-component system CheB/CheR fusion protein